jgi:hypothetical protein
MTPALAAELVVSEIQQLLAELAHNTGVTGLSDILLVSTNRPHAGVTQPDQPIVGINRTVLTDRRGGAAWPLVPATPTQIVFANDGRTGLQVTNASASVLTLYLGSLAEYSAGLPLPSIPVPAGGNWGGLLSKVLWAGDVTAILAAAATTTQSAVGSVTAPAAGAAIATLAGLAAGTYTIECDVALGGTSTVADNVNFELKVGATVIGAMIAPDSDAAATYPPPNKVVFQNVVVPAATSVTVNAVAAGGGAASYLAGILATPAGNQQAGTAAVATT